MWLKGSWSLSLKEKNRVQCDLNNSDLMFVIFWRRRQQQQQPIIPISVSFFWIDFPFLAQRARQNQNDYTWLRLTLSCSSQVPGDGKNAGEHSGSTFCTLQHRKEVGAAHEAWNNTLLINEAEKQNKVEFCGCVLYMCGYKYKHPEIHQDSPHFFHVLTWSLLNAE